MSIQLDSASPIDEELGADGKPSGVEKVEDEFSTEPFDPASISIESKIVPMDTLLRRLRQGSIRLAPSFQRKYVWDSVRKSQLIESLMLRIPLPMFYVSANDDGTWDVVDGLQRLTTIRDFLLGGEVDEKGNKNVLDANEFKLSNLEFWGDRFNTKNFTSLKNNDDFARIVNNILETELRFTVINPGTPEEVKRNIFKRINTGGMPLTQQEIRHALYQGQSTLLLEKLVNLNIFNSAVDYSVVDSRMAGRELILRFLAFFIHKQVQYTYDMDKFLSNAMRIINLDVNHTTHNLSKIFSMKEQIPAISFISAQDLQSSFDIAMRRNQKFFGKFAFRKAVEGERRTPVNKALFESWSNIFAVMPEKDFNELCSKKISFNAQYRSLLYTYDFDRAISRDSSSPSSASYRYSRLNKLIMSVLGE